jgi:hypothetical protein
MITLRLQVYQLGSTARVLGQLCNRLVLAHQFPVHRRSPSHRIAKIPSVEVLASVAREAAGCPSVHLPQPQKHQRVAAIRYDWLKFGSVLAHLREYY